MFLYQSLSGLDSSGVAEMRTLLSKFQRSRDERQFEKQTDASQSDVALPSNLPSSAHQVLVLLLKMESLRVSEGYKV